MIKFTKFTLMLLVYSIYLLIKTAQASSVKVDGGDVKNVERYKVAGIHLENVAEIYPITLWILLGMLAKIGFHFAKKFTKQIPESCLLVLLGVTLGGLLYATKLADQKAYVLQSETFFLFLLPPIILEAGYFMPNRPFFDNVGTILLFAIVNTIFNTFLIGVTLWAFNDTPFYGGTHFDLLHCLLFAALISAVDPVAVLATFVEIGVNDMLYIIVFGESLLNDGVSVVLYRLFATFSEMGSENVIAVDMVLGACSFLIVAIGGVLIGIVFGVIGALTTKYTEQSRILEPLVVLVYSYLSYITAEMLSTSGILAITFCGMFLKQYVELNIAKKSSATIEYVLKMLANIMETIIFLFIGVSVESGIHRWNTGFVIITLLSCSIYRVIGVFIFANLANRWRLKEIQISDMLIMSYGGIRGAVAFALALILDEKIIPTKKEFVTATTVVVFFTVFIQGSTIGPIVNYLKVKRKETDEPKEFARISKSAIEYIMSSFEGINGVAGDNSLRHKIRELDRKYIKPFLCRGKPEVNEVNLLRKLNRERRASHINTNNSDILKKIRMNRADQMILNQQVDSPKRQAPINGSIEPVTSTNQIKVSEKDAHTYSDINNEDFIPRVNFKINDEDKVFIIEQPLNTKNETFDSIEITDNANDGNIIRNRQPYESYTESDHDSINDYRFASYTHERI